MSTSVCPAQRVTRGCVYLLLTIFASAATVAVPKGASFCPGVHSVAKGVFRLKLWRAKMTNGPALTSPLMGHPPRAMGRGFSSMVAAAAIVPHREGETNVIPGGVVAKEHFFTVPVDWQHATSVPPPREPGAPTAPREIEIFVRELIPIAQHNADQQPQQEQQSTQTQDRRGLPYLLYLQGGPGFAAPRVSVTSGWVKRALKEYRVLLLDQRGTGRSGPISTQTLAHLPPAAQLGYLRQFRADNIVRDCEAVRATLLGPGAKWSVLGQSFGGFCLLTYLSMAPQSIEAGLFTGGLPPVGRSAEEVYTATYKRLATRNLEYYARYPSDVALVREIASRLLRHPEPLPSGGFLTPYRFLQLGICLGSGTGMEDLHYLLEDALLPHPTKQGQTVFSYKFLRSVETWQSFDTNPLYALLHEPIYCEGVASQWSAQRTLRHPEVSKLFNLEEVLQKLSAHKDKQMTAPENTSQEGQASQAVKPVFFLGEMILPSMFDGEYPQLTPFKEVAHMLAQHDDWPRLYDPAVLSTCNVPCAAIVYFSDVFVEREFSEETARLLAPSLKVWITNEFQHSGIREDGFFILDRLLGMLRGEVNIPS